MSFYEFADKVKFNIDGYELEYDKSILKYAFAYEVVYDSYVDGGLLSFFAKQYWNMGSPSQIYEFCNNAVKQVPAAIAEGMVAMAIDFGIYDLTVENFWDIDIDGEALSPLYTSLGTIIDAYENIKNFQLSEERRRELRRATRMRVLGGGFGFKGALKGMIEAGAINMTTGFAHSLFNSVGNFLDRQRVRTKLEQLYNDRGTLKLILKGIVNTHLATFSVFNSKILGIDVCTKSALARAKNLISNLKSGRIPDYKIKDVSFEILQINPYLLEPYAFLPKLLSDNQTGNRICKSELLEMLKYFKIHKYIGTMDKINSICRND